MNFSFVKLIKYDEETTQNHIALIAITIIGTVLVIAQIVLGIIRARAIEQKSNPSTRPFIEDLVFMRENQNFKFSVTEFVVELLETKQRYYTIKLCATAKHKSIEEPDTAVPGSCFWPHLNCVYNSQLLSTVGIKLVSFEVRE